MSGLLADGRAFRLRQIGCENSGATAALWFDSKLPLSDAKTWSNEIVNFARIVFTQNEASEIRASLHSGKVTTTVTDDRLVIDGAPEIFMRYTVTVAPAEEGMVMTITYSLG